MSSYNYKWVKTENGYVLEHRYIMEQHLGRKLAKDEVVHHINANHLDNRIENLQVMTISEHNSLKGKQLKSRKGISILGNGIYFTVRLPIELNEKIEKEAKQLGISKNSYIVMKLQDKIKK